MSAIGFIILRHVRDEITNRYWMHCYDCIRKYYTQNDILIIDDASNYDFVSNDKVLYKTTIINSEYPGRGELLPYYYYLRNPFCDNVVILHDSVFINSFIDFTVDYYAFLWCFQHTWDQPDEEKFILSVYNDDELYWFYDDNSRWVGCFGAMMSIRYDFLKMVNEHYDIHKMLDVITSRPRRCFFERAFACLLQKFRKPGIFFGDIHEYCHWGITFDEKDKYSDLQVIKVWTGR